MLSVIIKAIVSFAATNIDDILILSILFSISDMKSVVIGQFAGMSVLIIISIIFSIFSQMFLAGYVWLLGLVPIILGIRAAIIRNDDDKEAEGLTVLGIAALTVSNGADNIGVYTPLFAQYSYLSISVTAAIFLLLTGLLCLAASCITSVEWFKSRIVKYQRIIVPIVFIAIGISILIAR